jgi:O-antigen/teichoic acid export membrane protein
VNGYIVIPDKLSLKTRVINAGVWTLAGFAFSTILRLGSNLLMTRLLAPEMFGVIAIAWTVIVGLGMFSDLGLKQSVVQSRRGHEAIFLNTAWSIQILRGSLLWVLALLISVAILLAGKNGILPAGSVYALPATPYVLAVVSFSAAIGGFDTTKLFEASRTLSLNLTTKIDIFSQMAGLAAMICWVSIDRSIWALVAGGLSSTLARVILGHATLPGTRNRWEWDKSASHEVIHFGKWILLASILGFLVNSGDRLLLGGLIDAEQLGLYSIALLLISTVDGVLSRLIGDISFPAFSEVVRERRADLRRNYYHFHKVIAAIAYSCGGVLVVSGHSLIALLYDRRYEQAGWMVEALSVILLTVPFRLATQSFLALGLPRLQTNIVIARLILLFTLTPLSFHLYGMPGALSAIILSQFSSIPLIIFYNMRHGLFDLRKELFSLAWIPAGFCIGEMLTTVLSFVHLR